MVTLLYGIPYGFVTIPHKSSKRGFTQPLVDLIKRATVHLELEDAKSNPKQLIPGFPPAVTFT
jgi:hypothetical protein